MPVVVSSTEWYSEGAGDGSGGGAAAGCTLRLINLDPEAFPDRNQEELLGMMNRWTFPADAPAQMRSKYAESYCFWDYDTFWPVCVIPYSMLFRIVFWSL